MRLRQAHCPPREGRWATLLLDFRRKVLNVVGVEQSQELFEVAW
jgi:hypothetical protein